MIIADGMVKCGDSQRCAGQTFHWESLKVLAESVWTGNETQSLQKK